MGRCISCVIVSQVDHLDASKILAGTKTGQSGGLSQATVEQGGALTEHTTAVMPILRIEIDPSEPALVRRLNRSQV